MKFKYEFVIRQIVGEYVLVPVGEGALSFSGMITTSEVGAFICDELRQEVTRDQLLAKLTETYDVDEQTAKQDLDEFLDLLRKYKLLVE